MRARSTEAIVCAALLLLATGLRAGVIHPSIGVCTRKDEFARRQEALDPMVASLSVETNASSLRKIRRRLVKTAEKDIECLIRYREPALVPVLAGVVESSRNWFTRSRALSALTRIGDPAAIAAGIAGLDDRDAMVRDAAASLLGHLGGPEAKAALEERLSKEKDPFVRATLEASRTLVGSGKRPYDEFPGGKVWREELTGPENARRVAWAWTVEGQKLFNAYDASPLEYPTATTFVYPVARYEEDLLAGYPRKSFGAGGTHAGEDCAWFRDGSSIYAVADGLVRMVQGAGGDWGFLVAIEHRLPDGRYLTSVYGHMGHDVLVRPGDVVEAGQKIGTQGLSASVENGGYGAHLHFGLGDGPFRRPAGAWIGANVNLDLGGGRKVAAPIVRLVYAEESKNSYGWPLTAMVIRRPDGSEQTVEIPEQPIGREIGWFQAYVRDCRGWLNPQTELPKLVGK